MALTKKKKGREKIKKPVGQVVQYYVMKPTDNIIRCTCYSYDNTYSYNSNMPLPAPLIP